MHPAARWRSSSEWRRVMSQNGSSSGQKVGDFIAERLRAWGVTRVYGYAGDGINGIIGGIQRAVERGRSAVSTIPAPPLTPLAHWRPAEHHCVDDTRRRAW